jgi:hypothetical protein
LDKLGLEEATLINWTIEKSLEANIPEEVVTVLLRKEILLE